MLVRSQPRAPCNKCPIGITFYAKNPMWFDSTLGLAPGKHLYHFLLLLYGALAGWAAASC